MDDAIISSFERRNGALAAILREHRGRRVKYVPNPGNAGDSLIAAATYQLFAHYGVPVDIVTGLDHARRLRGETVVLGGGGNLVPMYSGTASMMAALMGGKNRIVLLPHTIRGNETLLSNLPSDTLLFCREAPSYAHVLRHAVSCDVELAHDLALYVDREELDASPAVKDEARDLFQWLLEKNAKLTPEGIKGRKMSCMRHGVEKTFIPKAPNYDISVVFRTGVIPREAELGAWMMLEFTRLAAEITTNRLHVGIAAALTGTTTTLHDNSYGKVSSIFLHSMRRAYPFVTFKGEMIGQEPDEQEPQDQQHVAAAS